MRAWKLLIVVSLLGGCGSSMTHEERTAWQKRVAAIQVRELTDLEGRQFEVLGEVVGTSCTQSRSATTGETLDEQGTPHAAKRHSRFGAEKFGADAVTSFVCNEIVTTPSIDRCRKQIRCTGKAIRFTE